MVDWSRDPEVIAGQRLAEQKRPGRPVAVDAAPIAELLPELSSGIHIKINPMIGLAALPSADHTRPGLGGAWRAWVFARACDDQGSGKVSRVELRQFLKKCGVKERTGDSWIDWAVHYGLLEKTTSKRDNKTLYGIVSEARGALFCGAGNLSPKPVIVPADLLIGKKTWKAFVYVAWRGQLGMISQVKIEQMTGISDRSQRRYLKSAEAHIKRNVARYDKKVSQAFLDGLRDIEANPELGSRGYYKDKKGRLSKRLPDSVGMPKTVAMATTGRTKKNRKALKTLLSRDYEARELLVKLFCEDDDQLKKSQRMKAKMDVKEQPPELYLRTSRQLDWVNFDVVCHV